MNSGNGKRRSKGCGKFPPEQQAPASFPCRNQHNEVKTCLKILIIVLFLICQIFLAPAGPSSLPESPGSPGYDFINFPAATIEEPQLVPLTESPQYVQKQQRDTTLKTITTIEMVERQLRMGEEENEQFVQLLEEQKELARRRRRSDKQQPAGEIESDAIAAAVEPMVVDAGTIGASTTLQKEPVCAEAHTAIEERKPLHGGEKQRVEGEAGKIQNLK